MSIPTLTGYKRHFFASWSPNDSNIVSPCFTIKFHSSSSWLSMFFPFYHGFCKGFYGCSMSFPWMKPQVSPHILPPSGLSSLSLGDHKAALGHQSGSGHRRQGKHRLADVLWGSLGIFEEFFWGFLWIFVEMFEEWFGDFWRFWGNFVRFVGWFVELFWGISLSKNLWKVPASILKESHTATQVWMFRSMMDNWEFEYFTPKNHK